MVCCVRVPVLSDVSSRYTWTRVGASLKSCNLRAASCEGDAAAGISIAGGQESGTSGHTLGHRNAGPGSRVWGTVLTRFRLIWRDALALLLVLGDRRTPAQARLAALLALMYALSPVDLLPDLAPLLGVVDDALIVPTVLALAARRLPAPVLQQAQARAARLPWLLPLCLLVLVGTGALLWTLLGA